MREIDQPVFEPAASEFIGHYDKVRGFLRQEVVHHRLEPFLEDDNQLILDYGGGEALDSIWVANRIGQVDYWDNTSEMRTKAAANVASSGAKVNVLQNDPSEDLTSRYNILMLHVVLQYLEPEIQESLIVDLANTIVSGGVLSLMDRNWNTVEEQGDGQTRAFMNGLDLKCRVFSAEYWQRQLQKLGFETINMQGVRGLYEDDKRLLAEVDEAERAKMALEEINWSSNPESVKTGRLLHILAVKL